MYKIITFCTQLFLTEVLCGMLLKCPLSYSTDREQRDLQIFVDGDDTEELREQFWVNLWQISFQNETLISPKSFNQETKESFLLTDLKNYVSM